MGFTQNGEEREERRGERENERRQGRQTSARGRDDKCPQDGRWEERMKMRREGRQVKIHVFLSPSEKKRKTADIRAPEEVKRKNRW